jgi:hypothetical protein
MDEIQEAELTGLNDCLLHWHSSDRAQTQDTINQQQQVTSAVTATVSRTLTTNDNVIAADTTSGNVTLTLPIARNGKEFIIVKIIAANTLTILPSGTDTINGAASLAITIRWTSIWLKAVSGGWLILSRYL